MFDGYVLTEGSVKNYGTAHTVEGFELRTRIPYYRGVPLSMVHAVEVTVDGTPVPSEDIRFSADDGKHWFTLEEMWTVASFRWEYQDEARIRVVKPNGLIPGTHRLRLKISVRVAYILVGTFDGEMEREVQIDPLELVA